MPIYRPSQLHQLGIFAKKSLSQNFLIDQNILEKICSAAHFEPGDTVIEIGPGPGALTEKLLEKNARVIAIEKDARFIEHLHCLKEAFPSLEIYHEDALNFPFETLTSPFKVVANLPYHITTPILQRLIPLYPQVSSLTLMVQKEVGMRMCALKKTPAYGSLSVFIRAYSIPKYCFTVKPTSFFPSPAVHSCVVHLNLHPFFLDIGEEQFFHITRTAFGKRRKMLRSSLKNETPSDSIECALKRAGIAENARPEELSLEEFASLVKEIYPR